MLFCAEPQPSIAAGCATKMFTERADGPHTFISDLIAVRPTVEEIAIGQKAVAAALGEKGSEKCAHANRLCADGLILSRALATFSAIGSAA